ncbi:MAG: hypothetical protein PHX93_01340 [Candidatus Peribacteraceae bacterium]|jgi:hypothetical protein|nr:hypothetical protein [Candidatus Peribacteraceae bacterium]
MNSPIEGNRQELQATKRQLELRSSALVLRSALARQNLHSYLAMAESDVPDPNALSPGLTEMLERMDAPGADAEQIQAGIIGLIQAALTTLDAREQRQIKPESAEEA